jgi:hypothetical protein
MALILINGIMRGEDMSPGWRSLVRAVGEDWEYGTRLLAQSNDAGYALMATLEQAREAIKRAASQEAILAFFEAVESWNVSDQVGHVTNFMRSPNETQEVIADEIEEFLTGVRPPRNLIASWRQCFSLISLGRPSMPRR